MCSPDWSPGFPFFLWCIEFISRPFHLPISNRHIFFNPKCCQICHMPIKNISHLLKYMCSSFLMWAHLHSLCHPLSMRLGFAEAFFFFFLAMAFKLLGSHITAVLYWFLNVLDSMFPFVFLHCTRTPFLEKKHIILVVIWPGNLSYRWSLG